MKKAKKFVSVFGLMAVGLTLGGCGGNTSSAVSGKRTHDQHTHVITGKSTTIQHNFVDGKCTMCDETTIFRQDPMSKSPEILSKAAAHTGTLEYFWYKTRAYGVEEKLAQKGDEHAGQELWIYKRAFAYLPYGYDKNDTSKKYNVVYMMHGDGLNEGYWFRQGTYARAENQSAYTGGYGTENVIDHLVEDGTIQDTIFITMTMYNYYEGEQPADPANPDYIGGTGEQANYWSGYVDPENDLGFRSGKGNDNQGLDSVYYKEFNNHLMPYVVEHYNTYAASSSDADMKAARNHVGFTGLSRGGGICGNILANSLEYVSWFAYESGGQPGEAQIANIKAKPEYPVNYCFVSSGSQEGPESTDAAVIAARDSLGWTDGSDLAGGDKICYITVNGTAHNYSTWITNLYNFMHIAFKK